MQEAALLSATRHTRHRRMDAQFLMDADLVQGLDELDQTAKPTQAPAEELAWDARHAERLGMRTAAVVSSCSHACNHHLLFINFHAAPDHLYSMHMPPHTLPHYHKGIMSVLPEGC